MYFTDFVINKFKELSDKFKKKHDQYKGQTSQDELANFRAGANLKYGRGEMPDMYEMSKDYVRKHIAYIETHGIEGKTVEDSLEDIAVYAVIMLYMRYIWSDDSKVLETPQYLPLEKLPGQMREVANEGATDD